MRKLANFLVILLVLVGAGDWLATTFTEGAIEERIENDVQGAAHVEIDSWPVITRAAVTQEVGRLTADLSNVVLEEIEIERIEIKVIDLRLSRSRLLRGEIDPKSIRSGSVAVVITQAAIAEAAGFIPEATELTSATVTVQDGSLGVETGGTSLMSISFPEEVLPCSATGSFSGDDVRLSCSVNEIPEVLLRNLLS